jgi:hypothetical protein
VSLPGQVEAATPSVPGFDCDTTLSASLARAFYTQGYKFCFRYLSRETQSAQDLTEPEATDILNSGLAVMPVQHVRSQGWSPSLTLGQQDGQNAAQNSQFVGFPAGVSVWCDLEGVNRAAQAHDVIDYCEAWYEAVRAAGYVPGLYVGACALLKGKQLYNLSFQHYWRSQSRLPEIPNRGYQLIQLTPSIEINGVDVDIDIAQDDKKGGQAQWLRLESALRQDLVL